MPLDPTPRTCNRCGIDYLVMHTCAHPIHAAIDPECVYASPDFTPPDNHVTCDVCRPIRIILTETST